MTILIPALAVAYAAFCVWLPVRIVNRRERWAKWTLTTVVGLPVLYVASFGPACWWMSNSKGLSGSNRTVRVVPEVFHPICNAERRSPKRISIAIKWYATLAIRDDEIVGALIKLDTGEIGFWSSM